MVADGLRTGADGRIRCAWAGEGEALQDYRDYHDAEWGWPVQGERELFERISLEAFQSGLAWITILRKRPAFREAFAAFDPEIVARFTDDDLARLMTDAAIVRNRRKIEATRTNARVVLALRADGGLERIFAQAAPARSERPRTLAQVPAQTAESAALAARLKRAGFVHVGPTTLYAAMQACGLVRDHLHGCWAGDRIEAAESTQAATETRENTP